MRITTLHTAALCYGAVASTASVIPIVSRSSIDKRSSSSCKSLITSAKARYADYTVQTPDPAVLAAVKNATDVMRARRKHGGGNGPHSQVGMIDQLYPDEDLVYVTNVCVGTPAQEVPLLVDTGSGDFWVMGKGTPGLEGTKAEYAFDTSKSSSWKYLSDNYTEAYGSGFVNGSIGTETVKLGNFDFTDVSLGVSTYVDDDLQGAPFSGVIGFSTFNSPQLGGYTVFQRLILEQRINLPLFSLYLTDDGASAYPDEEASGSLLCMACIVEPPVKTVGSLNWHPVAIWQDWWAMWAKSLAVNGKTFWSDEFHMFVDSGTTIIILPPNMTVAFYETFDNYTLDDEGNYMVPANATYDSFTLGLGDQVYQVRPADLFLGYSDETETWQYLSVQSTTDGVIVFGDVFLKSVLSVYSFDYDGQSNWGVGLQQLDINATLPAPVPVGNYTY